MRMMADVDTYAGLTALRGLAAARELFAPYMTLQLVAFPQEGIFTNPGFDELENGGVVKSSLSKSQETNQDQRESNFE